MAATRVQSVIGIDPRQDVNARVNRINIVPQGTSNTSYQKTTSNNVSNSNCTFNVPVPNARYYVPRVIYLTLQGNTVFTGNSGLSGQTLLQAASLPHASGVSSGTSNLFGPRCDPINQILQQITININGQQISSNTGQYERLLQRFNSERDEREFDLSMSPMMPDVSLDYSADEMSSISPLRGAQYNDYQIPRGAFPQITITANTSAGTSADTATVYWNFTTPIVLSPFCYSRNYQEKLAFVQLTQLEFQFTFGNQGMSGGAIDSLSTGLWCFTNSLLNPNPPTLSGATTTVQTAVMYNQFLYPPEWQSIPPNIFYSYSVPTWLPNNIQSAIAPGATGQIVLSQAIQRNQTMADMIFYVGERAQDASIFKPDVAFFALTALTLQWDGGAPAFSTMSQYDLYQSLHVVKGGKLSWRQWSGAVGAPGAAAPAYDASVGGSGTNVVGSYVRITPGIDIPLPPGDAPSCSDQKHTLLFTATVTNLTNRSIYPSANVLVIDTGIFKIDRLVATQQTNIVTPLEVKALEMEARNSEPVPYAMPSSLLGGSFLKDVGRFLKKLARPAINIAKATVPEQYRGVVNAVDEVARSQGIGMGDMKGGRGMSKKQLAALAYHV